MVLSHFQKTYLIGSLKNHTILNTFFFAFFIRQVHAVSPDESSMASPVRLKRYEGFEHGLNVMGRSRGGPYRNKSPPVKKTKRKETIDFGPPSTPNEKNNDRYVFLGKLFFFT